MSKTIKPFEGVGKFTSFPNLALDHIMPKAKPNTWKIVCVTIRKTIGWHKKSDGISITQYMQLCGIASKQTAHKAIQDALDNKFIIRTRRGNIKGKSARYKLNKELEIEVSGTENVPDLVQNPYPQKKDKDIKEDDEENLHNPHKIWEKATGQAITPQIADELTAAIQEWDRLRKGAVHPTAKTTPGDQAVCMAITLMGKNGVRSTTYVDRILFSGDRPWLICGVGAKLPKPSRRSHNGKQPQTEWDEDEMEATRQSARERIKLAKEK